MSSYLAYEDRDNYDGSRERIFTGLQIGRATKPSWSVLSLRYGPIILLLLLGVISASWWFGSNAGERELHDWRPLLAQAEMSREAGDLYQADALYTQAGRVASWRRDWVGLSATACGMSKLYEGSSLAVIRGLLIGAMFAAQDQKSNEGLRIVANAFGSMGQDSLANTALSLIQEEWPDTPSFSAGDISQSCSWR